MQAREIRRAYLDMLVEHGHVIIPRAPLVLRDDPDDAVHRQRACSRC